MIYSLINVKVWLRLKWMFENDADLKCFILLSAANKWKEGESRGDVCADERREEGATLKGSLVQQSSRCRPSLTAAGWLPSAAPSLAAWIAKTAFNIPPFQFLLPLWASVRANCPYPGSALLESRLPSWY